MKRIDEALLRSWPLPECPAHADKVNRGTVLIVAGGAETPGAAILSGIAALRAGAGRLTVLTAKDHAGAIAVAVPEARVIASVGRQPGAADTKNVARDVDAVLIGPGIREREACHFARALMSQRAIPVILDAGAIPAVRRRPPKFRGPVLITPHAGELAHLEQTGRDDIEKDPARAANQAMTHWNVGVLLKGAVSYLSIPDQGQWQHAGGNAGLATSGSGDVLAGLIVGLVARGASLAQAAAWGVALHGRAGDVLAKRQGPLGYLARELAAEVPALMHALSRTDVSIEATDCPLRGIRRIGAR